MRHDQMTMMLTKYRDAEEERIRKAEEDIERHRKAVENGDKRDGKGWTYFAQPKCGGPIKIGHTRHEDTEERLSVLQTGCPFILCLVGLIKGHSWEKTVQRTFVCERLHGEWFYPTKRLCAFILRQGHFGVPRWILTAICAEEKIHSAEEILNADEPTRNRFKYNYGSYWEAIYHICEERIEDRNTRIFGGAYL